MQVHTVKCLFTNLAAYDLLGTHVTTDVWWALVISFQPIRIVGIINIKVKKIQYSLAHIAVLQPHYATENFDSHIKHTFYPIALLLEKFDSFPRMALLWGIYIYIKYSSLVHLFSLSWKLSLTKENKHIHFRSEYLFYILLSLTSLCCIAS